MIIDITRKLEKGIIKVSKEWQDSKHVNWFKNNNYSKGAHGVYAYKVFLESLGYEAKYINDEGDLKYRLKKTDPWIKAEVKTSKVDLETTSKGFIKEQLWFNQIRPMQVGWSEIVLVGVYPNHIRIYKKTRKEWEQGCKTLSSMVKGLAHIGSNDLGQVTLKKNTRTDNFHEWKCIHNDQQGDLL